MTRAMFLLTVGSSPRSRNLRDVSQTSVFNGTYGVIVMG